MVLWSPEAYQVTEATRSRPHWRLQTQRLGAWSVPLRGMKSGSEEARAAMILGNKCAQFWELKHNFQHDLVTLSQHVSL